MTRRLILVLVIAALAATFLTRHVRAHDSWISRGGLRNAAGEWCCGANDCHELNYTPRAIAGGVQLDTGEAVPQSEVMPISPEGWVVCRRPDGTRRCVFAPPSGS